MMNYNGNGTSSSTPTVTIENAPVKVLQSDFGDFQKAIEREFTVYSAIDPALFDAAIEFCSDLEQGYAGEWEDPLAEFLGLEPKTTQNGFAMKRTTFGALLRNEDGMPWQAKLNYQSWDSDRQRYSKAYKVPKGNDSIAYTPPVPIEIRQKVSDRYGVEVPGVGSFWAWVLAHPELRITVTEGGKKTQAGLSQGEITIGLYGCNAGYRNMGDRYELIPQLTQLAEGGREIVISFDKDESKQTQSRVANATKKTAALLQREGAIVKLAQWKAKDGKGIDDLIVAKGGRAFTAAIDRAGLMGQMEVPQPQPQLQLQSKAESKGSGLIAWTSGMYLLAHVETILGRSVDSYICVLGHIHEWTGKYFAKVEDGILLRRIQSAFAQYSYESKGVEVFPFAKTNQASEALAYLKIHAYTNIQDTAQSGLCLNNGILRLKWDGSPDDVKFLGFELVPHDKKYQFLSCSEVDYNPAIAPDDCDRLLKAIPDEQRQTWLEHQALIFDFEKTAARFGRPRAGLHEGTGSNGKDSCRQAIADIFPGMGCFTFGDFQQYEDGRPFSIASLPKYRLSWSSENTSKVKLENLKSLQNAISANGDLRSEFKNQNPVDFRPDCLFHFNVNKAPITDASDFIKSRFVIYTYPYTYSSSGEPGTLQADERYAYSHEWRIKNVSSALLNRLCEAFAVAWERGSVDYSPCEARLKEWASDRNHILQFCEAIELVPGTETDSIEISELWEKLEAWYGDNDYLSVSNQGDREWASDPSNFDALVKKSADLFARLQSIFPKAKRGKHTKTRRSLITGVKFAVQPSVQPIAIPDPAPEAEDATQTQLPITPEPEPETETETETERFVAAVESAPSQPCLSTPQATPDRQYQVGDRVWAWIDDQWVQSRVIEEPNTTHVNPRYRTKNYKVRADGSRQEVWINDISHIQPILS